MLHSDSYRPYVEIVVWIILFLFRYVVHNITTVSEIYTDKSLSLFHAIHFLKKKKKHLQE